MSKNLSLFAGPILLNSFETSVELASKIKKASDKSKVNYIFRTTLRNDKKINYHGQTGLDILDVKELLSYIRHELEIPVCIEVTSLEEIMMVAGEVDYIEISSFLCNQDEIIVALKKSKAKLNIKKDVFQSLEDFLNSIERLQKDKLNFMITDEGTLFGYGNIIVDNIAVARLMEMGHDVSVDLTQSVNLPSAIGVTRYDGVKYLTMMCRSVCGVNVNAISLYIYNNTDYTFREGPNLLVLDVLKEILDECMRIKETI